MKILNSKNRTGKILLSALSCYAMMFATGCQTDVGGQTLPSAYYLKDDIQYFPTGPKFKLSQEAAAMKAYRESQNLQGSTPPSPPAP